MTGQARHLMVRLRAVGAGRTLVVLLVCARAVFPGLRAQDVRSAEPAHAGVDDWWARTSPELAIEQPHNGSAFEAAGSAVMMIACSANVAWPMSFVLAHRLESLPEGGGVETVVDAEHPMAELFPWQADVEASVRTYAEILWPADLPASIYRVRVTLSRAHGSDGAQGERIDLWSDSVSFSLLSEDAEPPPAALPVAQAGPSPHAPSCVPQVSGHLPADASYGVFFDFPPSMHHFEAPTDPHVSYRVEGDWGDDHAAHIYLAGVWSGAFACKAVASSTTPKGTLVMSTIAFETDQIYNVTVTVREPSGAFSRAASVLFTAAATRPQDAAVCLVEPHACVSWRDLDLPLDSQSSVPAGGDEGRQSQEDTGGQGGSASCSPPNGDSESGGEHGGGCDGLGQESAGWNVLLRPERIAQQRAGVVSKHASSAAPVHSQPDFSQFLRAEDGELVLLDDFGPGCVYRLFMPVVMGPGASGGSWRLRVRIDGDLRVDHTMDVLAELGTPPFVHPLAGFGDLRLGFYSMVPMVFRRRVLVSLLPAAPLRATAIVRDSLYCLSMEVRCDTKVYWDIDYTREADVPRAPPFRMAVTPELVSALALYEAVASTRTAPALGPPHRPRAHADAASQSGQSDSFRCWRGQGGPDAAGEWGGSEFPFRIDAEKLHAECGAVWVPEGVDRGVSVWEQRGGDGCVLELSLSGLERSLEEWEGGGREVGDGGAGWLERLWVQVVVDDAEVPQIDVAAHVLFLWNRQTLSLRGSEVRGLWVRHAREGERWRGSLYLPMPFERSIRVGLRLRAPAGAGERGRGWTEEGGVSVQYAVAWTSGDVCGADGRRGVLHVDHGEPTAVERHTDYSFFDEPGGVGGVRGGREGGGALVAVVADIAAAAGRKGDSFYEGDYRMWIDGSVSERVHETGTEDMFNSAHGYVAACCRV